MNYDDITFTLFISAVVVVGLVGALPIAIGLIEDAPVVWSLGVGVVVGWSVWAVRYVAVRWPIIALTQLRRRQSRAARVARDSEELARVRATLEIERAMTVDTDGALSEVPMSGALSEVDR